MPEINNSLALQIQSQPLDITKPLITAAQLRQLSAESALKEQEFSHLQGVYNRNQGYNIPEVQGLAQTQNIMADTAGRIGNAILQNPSDDGTWNAGIEAAKKGGLIRNSLEEANYRGIKDPRQRLQIGRTLQGYGQQSTSAIEQNPGSIAQRSQAGAGGAEVGKMYGPPGYAGGGSPGSPAPAVGGPAPAPGAATAASGGPSSLSLQERQLEAAGLAQKRVDEFNTYRQENDAASVQKVALRQLMQDAERVRTGAGADKEQAARKWLLAAGQVIPGLQGIADKVSDPVSAFESISKNAGIISRSAIHAVGGTAASELDAISKSLVGTETSQRGIQVNASQLVGLESYKQARFQAAQRYQDQNGTLKGFVANFNQSAGPAAWVYMSLPQDEREKIAASLRKSNDGKRVLNSIAKQLNYIHVNKLDETVD